MVYCIMACCDAAVGHPAERRRYCLMHCRAAMWRCGVVRTQIVEPLSSVPSSVLILNNTFHASRASGIILQTDNVHVHGNTISNTSSAAISSGTHTAARHTHDWPWTYYGSQERGVVTSTIVYHTGLYRVVSL